jgi:hypothetical protein
LLYRESRKTNSLNLKSTEKVNQWRERQIGKNSYKKETDGYMTKENGIVEQSGIIQLKQQNNKYPVR